MARHIPDLRFVIDRPADECVGVSAIFIGPTAVDLSAVEEADRQAAIRRSESQMLAAYRKRDRAHYSGQTKSWHAPRRA